MDNTQEGQSHLIKLPGTLLSKIVGITFGYERSKFSVVTTLDILVESFSNSLRISMTPVLFSVRYGEADQAEMDYRPVSDLSPSDVEAVNTVLEQIPSIIIKLAVQAVEDKDQGRIEEEVVPLSTAEQPNPESLKTDEEPNREPMKEPTTPGKIGFQNAAGKEESKPEKEEPKP